MKKVLLMFLALFAISLYGGEKQEKIIYRSVKVLNDIMKIPEHSIPPKLLRNAKAIAIIPHVVKAGFIIGGSYGKGVLLIKNQNGWSAPSFITFKGGSLGWQIGVQASDIILVFKDSGMVDGIVKGKFTLGADAAIAAGPVGRNALAATDDTLQAEIYSYSRSKGLFAGVSLKGSVLSVDDDYNEMYYKKEVYPTDIFRGYRITVPKSAKILINTISKYTNTIKK